jgi:hypothetical protein
VREWRAIAAISIWTGLTAAWGIALNRTEVLPALSLVWLMGFVPLVIYWYRTRYKSTQGVNGLDDGSHDLTGLARLASVVLVVLGFALTLVGLFLFGLGLYGLAAIRPVPPGCTFECGGNAWAGLFAFIGFVAMGLGFFQVWAGSRAWQGDDLGRILAGTCGALGALLGWWAYQEGNPHWTVAGREPWLAILFVYGFVGVVFAVRWRSRARTTLSG